MNTAYILRRVRDLAPQAQEPTIRDAGVNAHALNCTVNGRMRTIVFDIYGIVGESAVAYFSWPLSDEVIAQRLAGALNAA